MSQLTRAQGAEGVGRRETRDQAISGLRVVAEAGRFVIEPAPFAVRLWLSVMAAGSGIILLGEVAREGRIRALTLLGLALGATAIVAMQFLLERSAASHGPFLVVDRERGTMEIPRSGDAFSIDDVEAVTLHRGSYGGPDGLERAAWLGLLSTRRGESVENVPVAWSSNIADVDAASARLAGAIGRPLHVGNLDEG